MLSDKFDKFGSSLPRWRVVSKGLGAIPSGGCLQPPFMLVVHTFKFTNESSFFPSVDLDFFSIITSNAILRVNVDFFFFNEMSLKDELAWS